MNTGGIVGGSIHKEDARGGQHQFEQSTEGFGHPSYNVVQVEGVQMDLACCKEPLGYNLFLRNHHPPRFKIQHIFPNSPNRAGLYVSTFSTFAASANFSTNNLFASAQIRACSLSGNSTKEGKRSALNCSDASLGSSVGR